MKDYTEQINTEIMRILTENPIVGENGKKVHVAFAYYAGADGEPSEESNIVFRRNATKAGSIYGSGQQLDCKYYYYFDVHSKKSFFDIINKLIDILENNNFTHCPDLDGEDSYDPYAKQYCRSLMFSVVYDMTENKIEPRMDKII